MQGHIELSGLLRIDGDFSGTIKTAGRVLIGRNGRAQCNISADTVIIGGLFQGEITAASRVVVLSDAVVYGTITTPRFIAEEGMLMNCTLAMPAPTTETVAELTPPQQTSHAPQSPNLLVVDS